MAKLDECYRAQGPDSRMLQMPACSLSALPAVDGVANEFIVAQLLLLRDDMR